MASRGPGGALFSLFPVPFGGKKHDPNPDSYLESQVTAIANEALRQAIDSMWMPCLVARASDFHTGPKETSCMCKPTPQT